MSEPVEQSNVDIPLDLDLSFIDTLPPTTLGDLNEIDADLAAALTQDANHNLFPETLDVSSSWTDFRTGDDTLDTADAYNGVTEPDYTRFENWIPEFVRPSKPCDYCRSKHLDCYLRRGDTLCNPCRSLFRDCSLSSTTMEASNYASDSRGLFFDTLHPVEEDTCKCQGSRTNIKFLNSKKGHVVTSSSSFQDDHPSSKGRNGIRFPRHAVKTLREWLDAHEAHPYPTEEEKSQLETLTGLTSIQIANWLANARRRRKAMGKSRVTPVATASDIPRPSTPAIDIPTTDKPWDELNPFERWKHSPPENEPAAMTDIVNAVVNSDLPDGASTPSSNNTRHRHGSSNGSGLSARRAQSTTSAETSNPSSLSAGSSAAISHGSSHGSFGSFNSSLGGKKDRRRRSKRSVPLRRHTEDKTRTFQCTFCTDTFRSKYDWTRHEKSLHISLEKYVCAPIGPTTIDQSTGEKVCVYCGLHNPSDDHAESHNHRACEEKGTDSRTFYRKDHLRQHLRLMHGCELLPSMDAWKFTTANIKSRCGFCAQYFSVWQDRVDHLTAHFRAGTRMLEWKGCRGLDPAVAAQVMNAMPPYLIGIESVSPNPFSATTGRGMRHFTGNYDHDQVCQAEKAPSPTQSDELPPQATCWEILTVCLGKYANETAVKGIVLTDEMLQAQARRILYDSDDTWNQTAADNPEWLDLFKKAHGLAYIPSDIGGQGEKVPEDLEFYQDLGMRIPFHVQLQQLNKTQKQELAQASADTDAPKYIDPAADVAELQKLYQRLSKQGVLHDAQISCRHVACTENVANMKIFDGSGDPQHKLYHWCNSDVSPNNATHLARFINLVQSGTPLVASAEHDATVVRQESSQQAYNARATCLEHLQFNEVNCCPFTEQNAKLAKRREEHQACQARGYALKNLSHNECKVARGERPADKLYLPYHKATLPPEKARQFATITGAWPESGRMPQPFSTEQLTNPSTSTSTGAMMEFLGPAGLHLPFSTDVATSRIPLPTTTDGIDAIGQSMTGHAIDKDAGMAFADISFSSAPQTSTDLAWTTAADSMDAVTTAYADGLQETTLGDIDLSELDFDTVFDMSLDDSYGMHT